MKRCAFLLVTVMALLLTWGCQVETDITVAASGSGGARVEAELDPAFIFYLESFAELMEDPDADYSLERDGLFPEEQIAQSFEENPDAELLSVDTADPEHLFLELAYQDVEKIAAESADASGTSAFQVSRSQGRTVFQVDINIDNFEQTAKVFTVLNNPLFETFGPLENQGISEEEYLDMMEYALGEGGGELIRNSVLTTRVAVDGRIVAQKGGTVTAGDTVTFKTPLLELLLLKEPIRYEITFQ